MSLIHDALKKVQEKEKAPIGSGLRSFDDSGVVKEPKPKTTIILVVVLTLALAFFAYSKFFSGKKAVPQAALPQSGEAIPNPAFVQPDAVKLKKSAVEAYNADDLETAWNAISAADQATPNDPETLNNMGLIARKKGDVNSARDFYQKTIALKPDYPEALNNLAVLEMQSGNNSIAKQYLESALKISPGYPEANFHLGLLYDQSGDATKAIGYYKRFIDAGKDFPSSVVDSVRDRVMEIEPK